MPGKQEKNRLETSGKDNKKKIKLNINFFSISELAESSSSLKKFLKRLKISKKD